MAPVIRREADLTRARELLHESKAIRFSQNPFIDAKERLSLLTVAGRLRSIAVFWAFEKARLHSLRDVLINKGFLAFVSRSGREPLFSYEKYPPQSADAFRQNLFREKAEKVLWVCNNQADRERIRKAIFADWGFLLDYPACCVDRDQQSKKASGDAFLSAIIRAVGEQPSAIARALKENLKVAVEVENEGNVSRTERQFPFIMHVACNSCLQFNISPSAELNARHSAFVLAVDPRLHAVLSRMAECAGRMGEEPGEEDVKRCVEEAGSIYLPWLFAGEEP